MGNCSAKSTDVKTRDINSAIEVAKRNAKKEMKLLLLGAGESGKSTIFKQVRLIHAHAEPDQRETNLKGNEVSSKGFTNQEREVMAGLIRKQCVEYLRTLVEGAKTLALLDQDLEDEANTLVNLLEADGICEESAPRVSRLWNSGIMQETYAKRSTLQLPDSAKHFLDHFEEIAGNHYLPTDQDMLLSRVRTTGVSEMRFNIDGIQVRLVDVGGQRSERRKWIHCFDDVEAVIFVSAISEYDQVLFEDHQTNRLEESIKLFSEVTNSRFFSGAAKILFLNKRDLFEEKIKTVDLNVCFPEYQDGCNYDYALKYIESKFREQFKQDNNELYIHVTCATSTGNIRFVFESIRDTVLAFNFNAAGLL